MHKDHPWIHYLLLLFGVLCIAWSAILVKLANVSGFGSAFYRMLFGTIGIIPMWIYFRKPVTSLKGVKIAILCGVLFAGDIANWNTSIMLSKATISTLLGNLAPVWVGMGALLFMKEKPAKTFWIGTAIALFGVTIIIGLEQVFEAKLNFGNILAIVASMFYGSYLLIARKGRITLDTFSFTAISMLSSTVVLGLVCLFSSTPLWGFSTSSWLYLITLGLVPQLLGWLAINQALGHISPTVASVSLLSQTVFTAIFSLMVLGEMLTMVEITGAVVVLAGVYLVNKK